MFEGTTFLSNLNRFTIDLNVVDASVLTLVAVTRDEALIASVVFTLADLGPITVPANVNGQFVLGPLGDIPIPALSLDGTFDVAAAAVSATMTPLNNATAVVTVIGATVTATPIIAPTTVSPTLTPIGTFMPREKGASCALYPSCPQTGGECCPTPGGTVLSCCNPTQGT